MAARRKKTRRKKSSPLPILLGLGAMTLVVLLFSDLGLIRWFQLNREKNRLVSQISELKQQREQLKIERNRLETDMDYIEQIAREKFRMVKPGEKVFRVKDNRTVSLEDRK